jgi:hypothetical protein
LLDHSQLVDLETVETLNKERAIEAYKTFRKTTNQTADIIFKCNIV